MFTIIVTHHSFLLNMEYLRVLFLVLCVFPFIFHLLAKLYSHGINFHCYVDHTVLYVPVKVDDHSKIIKLLSSLSIFERLDVR